MAEAFLITIKWDPDHSAFNLQWPHDDAITALGMLETAKGKILADMMGHAQHTKGVIVPVSGVLAPVPDS